MRALVGEGERIPFGYGVAYRDFCLDTKVAYPLLVHFVVRWARDFRFWLMSVGRPGYREQIEHAAWQNGYGLGLRQGRKIGISWREAGFDP